MNRPFARISSLTAGLSLLALPALCEGTAPPPEAPAATSASSSPARPAQRAYVDPKTGELASAPPSAEPAPLALDSHEGLVVERLRSGGVKVNLQHRFRAVMVATVEPDGQVKTECLPPASAAAATVSAVPSGAAARTASPEQRVASVCPAEDGHEKK